MLIANAEYIVNSLGVSVACTAIFDGVEHRLNIDMDDEYYAEFYRQEEDGTIQPANVYE